MSNPNRRQVLNASIAGSLLALTPASSRRSLFANPTCSNFARTKYENEQWQQAIDKGLAWLTEQQSRLGHWNHDTYPTAVSALASLALVCSGSTTVQGEHSASIVRAVNYLMTKSRANGLIGDPLRDNRYIYGHGFAMLFLSQVLGEEEDADRRSELVTLLENAIDFSVNAQTKSGGWGYVGAQENAHFDEGSTTITQVQGLRGCRNAGIVVPEAVIQRAQQYIYDCKNPDGGISYSSKTKGTSRSAITAAALTALYNAGDYDSEHVGPMWEYCKKQLHDLGAARQQGHWHYTYMYYAQVVYRQADEVWQPFRDSLYERIIQQQQADGSWQGNVSPIYVTACCLIILQLDLGFLPIFQR